MRGQKRLEGKEEFPLIFSACPQNYLCFLRLSAGSTHTTSHPLTQHCLKSNSIYLTVIFVLWLFLPSALPPGSLHYPVCGPWQDLGSPPADSVPLGRLLFFCYQNRLNYSGGKLGKKKLLMGVLDFVLSGELDLINQRFVLYWTSPLAMPHLQDQLLKEIFLHLSVIFFQRRLAEYAPFHCSALLHINTFLLRSCSEQAVF